MKRGSPLQHLAWSAAALAVLVPALLADAEVLKRGLSVWPTIAAMGASCVVLGFAGWALLKRGFAVVGALYLVAALPTGGVALFFVIVWWWLRDFSFWGGGH